MSAPLDPRRVFAALTAYQTSAALAAAIELGLFTHIAAGADTLPALARATQASERGLRALANHLVMAEFLVKEGERYRCTNDSAAFLAARSPAYMGSITTFLNGQGLVRCFDDLVGAVRRGGTAAKDGGTVSVENPVWVDFARAMAPMAHAFAPGLSEVACRGGVPERVLDVAAGHGLYGLELLKRSTTSTLVSQDWPNVLAVARENTERAGLGARQRGLPGSAFEVEFGTGFDAILVTNFLHHFSREVCTRFLAKCRAALSKRGRVAVLEFALEDDRVTPASSAGFDLTMLATTPEGQAYTVAEYGAMFVAAGLARPERHDLPHSGHTVLFAGGA